MICDKCGQERPEGEDVVERAWDLIHLGCGAEYTFIELKAAVEEFHRSGSLLRAVIAAAYASHSMEGIYLSTQMPYLR